MGKKRLDEILARLEALEARLGASPPPPTPPPEPGLGEGFDEKRIIDLIVRLTTEQVEQAVTRVLAKKLDEHRIDEKRLVDAIGRTVTERVEEIGARMRREWEEGTPHRERGDEGSKASANAKREG